MVCVVCEEGKGREEGGGAGFPVLEAGPPFCVGVLRRRPTLPHPPRCSTIGVVGLSFQVRNVAGRFPNAMTTARMIIRIHMCFPRLVVVSPLGGVGWM